MSEKRTISNNIKYNALSYGIAFAIELFLFPFIVSHVGKEIYGIYLLVMTFTGYLGILELGVTAAVTKYVAELSAKGEKEEVNKIISSSFSLYFLIGLIVAAILFLLSFYFDKIFAVNLQSIMVMRYLFWIAAAASLLIWPIKIFEKALEGFQRFDLLAMFNIARAVLTAVSAVIIFNYNFGIAYFLILSYAFIILKSIAAFVAFKTCLPKSKIIFPYFDRRVLKMIFSFSIFLFLGNLVGLFIFDFDNFVIGTFVSVSAITLYGVGLNLQKGFRVVNGLLGTPLFSAGAGMEGKNDYEKQKKLLIRGTRYMTFIYAPAVIIAIIFAGIFINGWMGPEFSGAVLPAQVLIAFWIFNNATEVGSGLLSAKGHVKVLFKIAVLNAAINVILSLLLVKPFGILGVALGTTLPMILVCFPLTLYKILKILKISFREFFNEAVKRNIGIYALSIAASFLSLKLFQPDNVFLIIAEMGIIYLAIILISFAVFLSSEEKKEVLFMIKING